MRRATAARREGGEGSGELQGYCQRFGRIVQSGFRYHDARLIEAPAARAVPCGVDPLVATGNSVQNGWDRDIQDRPRRHHFGYLRQRLSRVDLFKVVGGRIARIDSVGLMMQGVATLGFTH